MDARKFATYLAAVVSPAVIGSLVERLGCSEMEAMARFYPSRVYAALEDEGTKVWHFSPELIAGMVVDELRMGAFEYPQEAL